MSTHQQALTGYQKFVLALLAFLQFTIVLDFMILSPLGAILLDQLHITTSRFGLVVSVYALSAGGSGLLAAGFADRFDRKRMLLFFYTGFLAGTFLCGIAPTYEFLLVARVVTGIFGGVIGSISFAIVADLFHYSMRGRVMGIIMTAFSASQILGLPVGLWLANHLGWHAPFLMIVGIGIPVAGIIALFLRPVTDHLHQAHQSNAFIHLITTVSRGRYLFAFAATTLLSTGGFMLMPFGSTFGVRNLGISLEDLPLVYMITGIVSMVAGPLTGRLSDAVGKYSVFVGGSIIMVSMVLYYTNLGVTPLAVVILVNCVLFVGISARMVSASALTSAVPDTHDRGAFMSVNSAVQQISGGIASFVAGLIVIETPAGPLQHYERLGYVVAAAALVSVALLFKLNLDLKRKHSHDHAHPVQAATQVPVAEKS